MNGITFWSIPMLRTRHYGPFPDYELARTHLIDSHPPCNIDHYGPALVKFDEELQEVIRKAVVPR